MEEENKKISLKGFLNSYIFDRIKDRKGKKFCFIIGSGASVQSEIRSGGTLAKEWLEEIEKIYDEKEVKEWKVDKGIESEKEAEKYSEIYEKRFELDKKAGYRFLEKEMENKEPSFGYSVFAQILEKTQHNLVITTNFDSLIEDAMAIYTKKRPLVLGHESLAKYIDVFSERPIIAKIHRDILLNPKSKGDETSTLEIEWKKNFSKIFEYYTPLVIGYGGNDGSLMGFLEDQDKIENGMFWFYWEEEGIPKNEKIQELVNKYDGYFVAIQGFDEMMIQFQDKLKFEILGNKIIEIAEIRQRNYNKQFENLSQSDLKEETKESLENIMKNSDTWWKVYIKIEKEKDIDKKEKLYKEGIKKFVDSAELREAYATFLNNEKKEYKEAEKYYKEALKLDLRNINTLVNYANFLYKKKENYEEVEKYYKKALELDSKNVSILGNYAVFLYDIKKEDEKAEKHFKEALKLDSKDVRVLGNYAMFLSNVRKDYEEAEKHLKEALKLDSKNVKVLVNYANFLCDNKKDYEEAKKCYKAALKIAPKDANVLGSYAKLKIETENYEEADKLIEKSLESNKNEENYILLELWFYRYAIYPKWYKEGKEMIEKLIEKGIKSINWNLDIVCEKAKKLNHKDMQKLNEFKKQITEK